MNGLDVFGGTFPPGTPAGPRLENSTGPAGFRDALTWELKTMVSFFTAAVVALLGVVGHGSAPAADKPEKDIVDTAVGAGQFKTLVTAVKAAELVETLKGEGPFTVFAPTDEAFARVPKETLDALLKDKTALAGVLTYHVVPGNVRAADVVKLDSAKTVQGQMLKIETRDGKVQVNGINVIKTDIICKNGVIHVIDGVLLPPSK